MLEAAGHVVFVNMRSDLPKFASKDRTKGTVEENKAVVAGSFAYFGTSRSDGGNSVLIFKFVHRERGGSLETREVDSILAAKFNETASNLRGLSHEPWQRGVQPARGPPRSGESPVARRTNPAVHQRRGGRISCRPFLS